MGDNSSYLIFIALIIGAFVVFFIIGRMIILWYFRIDEHITNQQRIIELLEIIATQEARRNVSMPNIVRNPPP